MYSFAHKLLINNLKFNAFTLSLLVVFNQCANIIHFDSNPDSINEYQINQRATDSIKATAQKNRKEILKNLSTNTNDLKIEPVVKEWAIYVYFATDNDLHYFSWNNIKQLANGAHKDVHIVVQLNEPGKNKKTQRYLIEKNKAILLNKENKHKLDSGDPQTLIDFIDFSIKNFPAKKTMLILSNHGSGIIDRSSPRLINPSELFVLNPSNLMLELDRNIEFLNFGEKSTENDYEPEQKGLCFDETYQTYFTNQKFEHALKTICEQAAKTLNQKNFKFQIIGIDACLMQMIEIADIVKDYANILIASQEVELGPGWRYDKILKPFCEKSLDEISFAKHIVKSYEDTYGDITNDYTLSAISLDRIDDLEKNISTIAEILIDMLQNQKDNSVKNILKKSKQYVAFEEPSYVDIASFYKNILDKIEAASFKNEESKKLINQLLQKLTEGLKIIEDIVIENVAGTSIKYAKCLSIYFPERRIHNSYRKTNFAQNNQWMNFILHYNS